MRSWSISTKVRHALPTIGRQFCQRNKRCTGSCALHIFNVDFVNVFGFDVLCSNSGGAENRRFVEVVVKARKRFEALRDFTVDGALEEVDRMNRERKDAGESTGLSSPRNASLDSARGPPSARSSSLRDVPEDSAFAIGEDEDDGEDGADDVTPMNASGVDAASDAVPVQSRSMSEKARGKQPVNSTSFSRPTSRTASSTSLSTYNTLQSTYDPTQPFAPTAEWVSLIHSKKLEASRGMLTSFRAAQHLSSAPSATYNLTSNRSRCRASIFAHHRQRGQRRRLRCLLHQRRRTRQSRPTEGRK
jgi:hypothetical protein